MIAATIDIDIAVIGGGIAGLWTLNQLLGRGYHAVLLERTALGSDQTIACQGMIHGGIKYALGGGLNEASEAVADMPQRWREALQGVGGVDLSQTQVLSDHFYMWSSGNLGSRLGTFVAGKALRGRIEPIPAEEYPEVFHNPGFSGKLLKLVDLVIDVPSLLDNLATNCAGHIFLCGPDGPTLERDEQGFTRVVTPAGTLNAQRILLTAGLGNESLLAQLGSSKPATQRRPLQQVLVKHELDLPLYAHCMGTNPSPRLTVSSHRCQDGSPVWYLGGDLASENSDLDPQALIDRASTELDRLFPWLDFGRRQWATIQIDRAEPRQRRLLRPDKAFAGAAAGTSNVIACWPTKLTLAPNLATEVIGMLDADHIKPRANGSLAPLQQLGVPATAAACWDREF